MYDAAFPPHGTALLASTPLSVFFWFSFSKNCGLYLVPGTFLNTAVHWLVRENRHLRDTGLPAQIRNKLLSSQATINSDRIL